MSFTRDDYLRRLLLRLRSQWSGSGGRTGRSCGTGRWDRKRLLLLRGNPRRIRSFSVHHPTNGQPRSHYKDQTGRAHHEAHLFAVAMEFGGHRGDGLRRDWSPARGTETPFRRLSAMAAKHHFRTSIRRKHRPLRNRPCSNLRTAPGDRRGTNTSSGAPGSAPRLWALTWGSCFYPTHFTASPRTS